MRIGAIGAVGTMISVAATSGAVLPSDFELEVVAGGFTRPVAMAFAPDGRLFVAEQRGVVHVMQNGRLLATPFIDLQDEVQNAQDRGLLGLALDPDFLKNRNVYLLYTVDPVPGRPDSAPDVETFSRLTRYTGSAENGGNVADLASRHVLIGEEPSEGIPSCHSSHTIGTVMFGHDGSLLVGAGDGAHFNFADAGGNADLPCFQPPLFGADQNVGSFRAQYLDSPAGKILRVDPSTGLGLADNPYFTGDSSEARSKVWAYGLRNPYRFAVRPDTPGPGTIYIADVGWQRYEEVNIARGQGENFGWPCREGLVHVPGYLSLEPAHSGCDTFETPDNPGPLTAPVLVWHHGNSSMSSPPAPGFEGHSAVGGVFYNGFSYPSMYRGGYFYADYINSWIRVAQFDESDRLLSNESFALLADSPACFVAHPLTSDLHYIALLAGEVRRIRYDAPTDLNDDGLVNAADLALLLGAWGKCGEEQACPADVNEDRIVNAADLAMLLGAWTIIG